MQNTTDSPAERRRIRVRGAILEAAERVFALEGEAGLSIRRIADEIDYSPAAIYKYFGSKDELVDELKEAFFARILASVSAIVDRSEPFAVRARKCVAGYVRTALEKPHHYVAAFAGLASEKSAEQAGEDFSQTNRAQAYQILTDMVEEGLETGSFRRELPLDETAKSIWASMHGLAMMMSHFRDFPAMATMPSDMDGESFIAFHADLIIRSLEQVPGADPINGEGQAHG